MLIESQDTMTPYKKKSSRRPPKKSDHKHRFSPCVFEYDGIRFDRTRGFIPSPTASLGSVCSVCGKISHTYPEGYSKKEFDFETRTLPTFKLDDYWKQKYVKMENK